MVSTYPGAATEPRGLTSTLVLGLGTFAVGTDAFVVAGFLPDMATELHVTTAAAGQSVTVFAVAYAVLAPIVATLTARLPRRTLLVGALLLLGLANLGSALSPGLPVLIVTRVLAAGGAAAFTPTAGAVSAALVRPELRARALAVVIGGLTIATALGVPLGDLASHWTSWRMALGLVAALCLLVAGGVFAIMPALPGGPRVRLRERLAVLRHPGVLAVLPLTVLGMGASYTVYAYSVPALHAVGIPESASVLLLFLYGLGAVLGNFGSGYATDRWTPVRVLTVGYAGMTVALGLLGWIAAAGASPGFAVGALVLLWGATTWTQSAPQQHRLIAAAPREAPLVVALNASAIYLGIGAGTALGGLVLTLGAPALYGMSAAVAALALVYLLLTGKTS
ncbi:MFS transporter [Amycolatopsis anabasis]|uniref:MFS transporter n=1 Tax=Amycolatopsis anabasis TaxID=1840409 RepID=UPI00131D883C|nr:MFS transporter [Amycolatopsis anabasis]